MIRFVFKDKTIAEARKQFMMNIEELHELNNGEIVNIVSVSELKKIELEFTNFNDRRQLHDSTLIMGTITKLFFGFEVNICKKNGTHYEAWIEKVCVPIKMKNKKTTIETDYEHSLIHTAPKNHFERIEEKRKRLEKLGIKNVKID